MGTTTSNSTSPPANSPPNPTAPAPLNVDLPLSVILTEDDDGGRLQRSEDRIQQLANGIARTGLINAIAVRPHPTIPKHYVLVAGRNRFEAVKLLGWQTIRATVHTLDHHQAATVRLAENVARSNLSPIEEAIALAPLVDHNPNGIHGVAQELGRSTTWIDTRLELLTWPDELAQAVHLKHITMAAAKWLARIDDPATRLMRIDDAVRGGINAATARMWYQDSRTCQPDDSALTEKAAFLSGNTIKTVTLVECFVCHEPRELENTIPKRICHGCLTDLGAPAFQTITTQRREFTEDHDPPPADLQPESIPQPPENPAAPDNAASQVVADFKAAKTNHAAVVAAAVEFPGKPSNSTLE
jgi:ParB family chromosome partitioning protein